MGESVFVIIHKNQSPISCVVAMILSVGTLIVTVFVSLELANYERIMKYTIYRAGFDDGASAPFKRPIPYTKFPEEKLFRELDHYFLILKVTCGMSFLGSILHFLSSSWTLFKRSPFSIVVWIVAQFITVGALITAITLPIVYKLKAIFLLSCFYAILSVDIFITTLLLIVVLIDFMDQRSASLSNDGLQLSLEINEDVMEGNTTVSVTGESSSLPEAPSPTTAPPSDDDNLPLPPPPPPPTTETATTT